MPVTAKLSRRFYEQLGDELANELVDWLNTVDATYRSDLDRLNELNFARFDAKLEQRLAQLKMELETTWEKRFAQLETSWEQRLGQMDAKWEQRIGQMETKWEQRLAHLEIRLTKDFAALRTDMVRWMFAFWTGTLLVLAGFLLAILKSH